jgi:hypothetical protein
MDAAIPLFRMEGVSKRYGGVRALEEAELLRRRDFLKGLKKWSQVVISGIVLGEALSSKAEAGAWANHGRAWVNRGGGGWVNHHSGGGSGWANHGRAWVNAR